LFCENRDTEAEDLIGIAKAKGILTSTGGNTAHAAVGTLTTKSLYAIQLQFY